MNNNCKIICKLNNVCRIRVFFVLLLCFSFLFSVLSLPVLAESQLSITQKKIKKLKVLEKREMNRLNRNQLKLEQTEKELNYSKEKYSTTAAQLKTISSDYNEALDDYNTVDVHVRNRIRQIYKTHTQGIVALLLASSDINDMLDKIYFQKIISKKDQEVFRLAFTKAKNVARIKYNMEVQKASLEQSIATMDKQQKTMQKAIDENEKYINRLKNDRATYERAEKELMKQSHNLENMISRTSKNDDYNFSSSGKFLKPIGGPITSRYGSRIHPIFKSRTFHSGIDIGGPNRGPVKAANNGKVIYAGWYGGYGRVVIIDHGKYNGQPTTTLYAHLNSINVSVGTPVVRGQVIGHEGTTGYSTGPHVHFEVRVNGQPRNPLNYI